MADSRAVRDAGIVSEELIVFASGFESGRRKVLVEDGSLNDVGEPIRFTSNRHVRRVTEPKRHANRTHNSRGGGI